MGMSELRQAAASQRSEVRSQKSEVRSQRSEISAAHMRNDLLIFAAFAMLLFLVLLTRAVKWEWAPLAEWDRVCCERLHEHGRTSPSVVAFFHAFTFLASTRMLFLEATAVALVLSVRRHWRLALAWMTALCSGYLMIHVLKVIVGRPRPVFPDPFELPTNFSFPSGHAGGAALVFGLLAYLLARYWPNRRWTAYACCSAFILAIGFSRLYLGAHWFSDVVGGVIIAMAWNLVAIAVMERIPSREDAPELAPARTPAAAPLP
jgi:membrane-associated phospholipid phosphatase